MHREIDNPRSSDQGTDSPGRSVTAGQRRSSYQETDWHQQAEDRFAADAAEVLEQIATKENGRIVVIAAPRSLGRLRKHYSAAIQPRLVAEIAKDLTNQTADEIVAVIDRHAETG